MILIATRFLAVSDNLTETLQIAVGTATMDSFIYSSVSETSTKNFLPGLMLQNIFGN